MSESLCLVTASECAGLIGSSVIFSMNRHESQMPVRAPTLPEALSRWFRYACRMSVSQGMKFWLWWWARWSAEV